MNLPKYLKGHNLLTDPSQAAEAKSGCLSCILNVLQERLLLQKKKKTLCYSPQTPVEHFYMMSSPEQKSSPLKPRVLEGRKGANRSVH